MTAHYTPFFKKFDGNRVYFLGDPHFSHKNIVKGISKWPDLSSCRDFSSTDEMNAEILNSINITVGIDDILIINGDMLFGDKTQLINIRHRINCQEIHYIMGNHCEYIRKSTEYQKLFTSCQDYLEIFCKTKSGHYKRCCIFHYPMKVWNDSHHGSYAITGHSHGSLPYTDNELGLDVGWDVWKKPISFYEVDAILSKRQFKPKDHHK